MSVVSGLERDLASFPAELREGALAQGALALARAMDNFETEPAEMASCFRALQAGLSQLRELAPPEEAKDGLDELEQRRARRVAGRSDAQDSSRA